MSEIIKKQGQQVVAIEKNDVKLKAVTEGIISPILKAECYVLNNGLTIIKGRGYIRSLTGIDDDIEAKIGGQRMKRMLEHKDLQGIIPQEILEKLSTKIQFIDKKERIQEGYDATTLPRLAIALWEAFLKGQIKEGHTYYNEAKNAGNIVKAFGDMGITGHIYQITGYNQIKGVLDLMNYFNQFIQDAPSDLKRQFETLGIFEELYRIYGLKRNQDYPWRHPQFFGHIFNKYIYWPLDLEYTKNNPVTATTGIMRHLLGQHKTNGQTLYAFINQTGIANFFVHLGEIRKIMRKSNNPKQLEQIFYQEFPQCNPTKTLPLFFPDDFMELAMLDIQKLTKKERPRKVENDLFTNEVNKNIKIIEAIQQEGLDFDDNNFEATLEKIALSKKPT